MRFSIIIPFNRGIEYIKDCLESLKAQKVGEAGRAYRDFEAIIIEDKPVDDISDILEAYKSEFTLRSCRLPENVGGVAAGRNEGIRQAQGDYIFFLDSDDYLLDNALAALAEEIDREPADIIYGDMVVTWFSRDGFSSTGNGKHGLNPSNRRSEESADDGHIYEGALKRLVKQGLDPQTDSPRMKAAWELVAMRSRYARISVLGSAYRRSFIEEAGLCFDEGYRYYSDIPFVCGAVKAVKSFRKCDYLVYAKRKHNDAIRFPSLSQEKDVDKLEERLASYTASLEIVKGDKLLELMLDEKLITYFVSFFCASVRGSADPKWKGAYFDKIRQALDHLPGETIKACDMYQRRLLKALAANKPDKASRIVSGRAFRHLLVRFVKHPRTALSLPLYHHVFMKRPVMQDWILFESFLGKTYGDSCRYIYEYMQKKYPDKKYIWVVDNADAKIPGKHKQVKPKSLRYFYYAARCGLWVNNMRQPTWYIKRPGMYLLETWHGTPLKKLVFDMDDVFSASARYKMTVYRQSRKWDYLLSDNAFSTSAFNSCFLYPKEQIVEMGYPRNDLLYGDDVAERAAAVKAKLGIPADKKVILYAPTWRDDDYYAPGQYKFDLPLDLKMMRKLKDQYVFVLRMHYFIADNLVIEPEDKDFVFECSHYNDIGELYLISDILITDYSSVFFDFANLRRPILYYVYDFEKYGSVLRGFYFDMATGCPGPLLRTNEEVLDALEHIDEVEAKYADKYKEFCDKFCYLDDGHAAERITEMVLADMKAGKRGKVGAPNGTASGDAEESSD